MILPLLDAFQKQRLKKYNYSSEASPFSQPKCSECHRPPKFSMQKLFLLPTHEIRSHSHLKLSFQARSEGHSSSPVDSSTQEMFNLPSLSLKHIESTLGLLRGTLKNKPVNIEGLHKTLEELVQQSLHLLCRLHWSQPSSLCTQSLSISVRALHSAIKELQAGMNLILSSLRQLRKPPASHFQPNYRRQLNEAQGGSP